MAFFDMDKHPINHPPPRPLDDDQIYNVDLLEDWAETMRSEVTVKDYANGWFAKHLRCVQGKEIYDWILEKVEDKKKAPFVCKKMLEK